MWLHDSTLCALRPGPHLWRHMMAERGPVLVIDIGGTKLAAGVAEPGGRLITWAQVPTPEDTDAEQLWRTLEVLLLQVLKTAKVSDHGELSGVGCGCGGPMEWPSSAEHSGVAAVSAAGPAGRALRGFGFARRFGFAGRGRDSRAVAQ